MFGHNYHFHIRLFCPPAETSCQPQAEVAAGECCDATLQRGFEASILHPPPPKAPPFPRPPLTMAFMGEACRAVAAAPGREYGEQ